MAWKSQKLFDCGGVMESGLNDYMFSEKLDQKNWYMTLLSLVIMLVILGLSSGLEE